MIEVVQDGAQVLRDVAKPVPEELFGSPKLEKIIADLAETVDRFPEGVAIAAPQIGTPYRLFLVRTDRIREVTRDSDERAMQTSPEPAEIDVYINPEIVKTSRRRVKADEGCLSVAGVYGSTMRHERVTIKARRPDGSHVMRGAGGLLAQIFEHEIDHLNGILFIDHATDLLKVPRSAEHSFVYFGTPAVSRDTLALLLESGFTPSLVVTAPDAPKGRGMALTPTETKVLAREHKIPVMTPVKIDEDTIRAIQSFGCDYAICVAYGKIFPQELIDSFPKGVLNVHYSLLPRHRGATPLEAALLAGDSETGVTVQKMVKELDAGDIIAQRAIPIQATDTARDLRPALIDHGAKLLVESLPGYLSGTVTPLTQDHALATRCTKRTKNDGLLNLNDSAIDNWRKYRAYNDTIGTYFFERGKRMKITAASFKNDTFILERVIPEGKREMAYQNQ